MIPQFQVHGYQHIWVSTNNGNYELLGYAEREIPVSFGGEYEPVMADYGGPRIPVDWQDAGQEAFVSVTLSSYTQSVFQKLLSRVQSHTPGTLPRGRIGTLMGQENFAISLCLLADNATRQGNEVPYCHTFPFVIVRDRVDVPVGTRKTSPQITFHAVPFWVNGVATLWTNDIPSGVSAPGPSTRPS